jgi:hypothetical protein
MRVIESTGPEGDKIPFLDHIEIDKNLLKWRKKEESKEELTIGRFIQAEQFTSNPTRSDDEDIDFSETEPTGWSRKTKSKYRHKKISLWDKILKLFLDDKDKTEEPKEETLDPSIVFKMVLANDEQLKIIGDKVSAFNDMITMAKNNGQVALIKRLESRVHICFYEDQLVMNNMTRVITEEQMCKIVKGYKKEIELTYVKNFIRPIPKEVSELKAKADELCIFDNYCVMHSDATAVKLTPAEIERRKDPILFGLIKNSRKFYYIGDWTDEKCDLTFDKLLELEIYSEQDLKLEEQIK